MIGVKILVGMLIPNSALDLRELVICSNFNAQTRVSPSNSGN
jgi:hypothetical protein